MYTLTAKMANGLSIRTWSSQISDLQRIALCNGAVSYIVDLFGEVLIDAKREQL